MNIPNNSPGKKPEKNSPVDASARLSPAANSPEDEQPVAVPAVKPPRRLFPTNSLVPGVLRAFLLVLVVIGLSALVFSLHALLLSWKLAIQPEFVDFTLVILLGMLVGFIEIVSRYQDAPFRTALAWPSLFYMLINGLVASSALWLVRTLNWDFTPGVTDEAVKRWTGVLIAGVGAMSIFRSALFVVGKEDRQISVGPNAVLEVLLNAIDKEVDRFRGQERASSVRSIMQHIHYEDAISDLTVFSSALMQNLSADDQERINISKMRTLIDSATNDDEVRKYLLGLRIIDVVGEDILSQAIGIRGEEYYRAAAKKRAANMAKQDQVAQLLRDKLEETKARLPQSPEATTALPTVIEGEQFHQQGLGLLDEEPPPPMNPPSGREGAQSPSLDRLRAAGSGQPMAIPDGETPQPKVDS